MAKGKGKKGKHVNNKQNRGGPPKPETPDPTSTRGGNKRGRNKKKQYHNNANYYNTAEDAMLRESIESDGCRTIIDTMPDGNCLFRSLSDQLYFDHGQAHADVRHEICDYLAAHESFFSLFLDLDDEETKGEDAADFAEYVQTMRQDGEWGGHLELVAAARLYRRRIRVFSSNLAAMDIDYDSDKPPLGPDLQVSYHGEEHYNSVRDNKRGPPPPPQRTFVKEVFEESEAQQEDCPSDETNETTSSSLISTTTTTTTYTTSNASSCNSESVSPSNESDEKDNEVEGNNQTKKPPKGTAPCPCNSGIKYKKCCKDKDRRQARRQRILAQHGSTEASNDDDGEAAVLPMDGNFRVLSI